MSFNASTYGTVVQMVPVCDANDYRSSFPSQNNNQEWGWLDGHQYQSRDMAHMQSQMNMDAPQQSLSQLQLGSQQLLHNNNPNNCDSFRESAIYQLSSQN